MNKMTLQDFTLIEHPGRIQLDLLPEYPELNQKTRETWCLLSVKAPSPPEKLQRLPFRIVFIVDTSASMCTSNKLSLCKEALKFVVSECRNSDEVAIISYNSTATTIVPLTQMSAEAKQDVCKKIDTLQANGSTNLSQGIRTAFDAIQQTSEIGSTSFMVMTDGHLNRGIRSTETLLRFVNNLQHSYGGNCQFNCFGVGNDHDSGLLKQLAEIHHDPGDGETGKIINSGMYYYIESAESIPVSFAEALGGLSSVYAEDLRVTIKLGEGVQITKVETQASWSLNQESLKLRLGDLQYEESREIPVLLKLPNTWSTRGDSFTALTGQVDYILPEEGELGQHHASLLISPTSQTVDKKLRNQELEKHLSRVGLAKALQQAGEFQQRGLQREAKQALSLAKKELLEMNQPQNNLILELEQHSNEINQRSSLFHCISSSQSHWRQRSNGNQYYRTKIQSNLVDRYQDFKNKHQESIVSRPTLKINSPIFPRPPETRSPGCPRPFGRSLPLFPKPLQLLPPFCEIEENEFSVSHVQDTDFLGYSSYL